MTHAASLLRTIILRQKRSILIVSPARGENEVQEDNNILQGTVLGGREGNQAKILSRSPTRVPSCMPSTGDHSLLKFSSVFKETHSSCLRVTKPHGSKPGLQSEAARASYRASESLYFLIYEMETTSKMVPNDPHLWVSTASYNPLHLSMG